MTVTWLYKNINNFKSSRKQLKFVADSKGNLFVSASSRKQVLNLEGRIIWCLDIIHSNNSFNAASGHDEKYKQIFPDSVSAKGYQQKAEKL